MSDQVGLTNAEAQRRLEHYGSNEIRRTRKIHPVKIFISQFTSPLIIILIIAALISWGIGFLPGQSSDLVNTILILVIVLASGISGFFQEYKSEKTIEALQKIAVPKTKVLRDGKEEEISVLEVVPEDIVILEAGDIVPADAKLIAASNLKIDESILTGESVAVKKDVDDEIFMDTLVDVGSGQAIVSKTGMQTKLGSIATKLQELNEEKTAFQTEIAKFSKNISIGIVAIIIIIIGISLIKYDIYLSILTSISLAVAAIPEGLPAVVVLTLAVGAKVMSKKNALIQKLAVTESIGAIDTICTDKTGTLTKNEMTVDKVFFNNKIFDNLKNNTHAQELSPLFTCAALCNNAHISYDKKGKKKYSGDQTEIAIRKISDKLGFSKVVLDKKYQRIDEIAFNSKRKMMSVICQDKDSNDYTLYSKGAPEVIVEKCNRIYKDGKTVKMTKTVKDQIMKQNENFASQTFRILAFAYKDLKKQKKGEEKNLIFLGLQAMFDPPRDEVKLALSECKTAGIRVVMLTGDSPLTAKAIAKDISLESTDVINGEALDKLSDKELKKKLDKGVNIFARISPFHKLRILEILKKQSRVAMTGDGVNDALALKKADIGIAMGVRGTEVAKEASDMILLDDNFDTIISAVKEGRRIFDNIRKFINYLFVCNFAEVGILFLATIFLTLKEPILLPIHLLWINLLTDGLPALALGIDPARPDIMKEKPRKKGEPIINKTLAWLIGIIGFKKIVILGATFFIALPMGLDVARTTLFSGFILYEFVRIGAIRSQEKLGWLSNKWLLSALVGSVLLQLIIVYTPVLNAAFHTVPLGLNAWIILIVGILVGYFTAIWLTSLVVKMTKD